MDQKDKQENRTMLDKLTFQQTVAFCVLMQNGGGIISKAPDYIRKKMASCQRCTSPEDFRGILDLENQRIFDTYFEDWGKLIR